MKTDRDSGIVNDPNAWCAEQGNPRYIVDLVKRVTAVRVRTMELVGDCRRWTGCRRRRTGVVRRRQQLLSSWPANDGKGTPRTKAIGPAATQDAVPRLVILCRQWHWEPIVAPSR